MLVYIHPTILLLLGMQRNATGGITTRYVIEQKGNNHVIPKLEKGIITVQFCI